MAASVTTTPVKDIENVENKQAPAQARPMPFIIANIIKPIKRITKIIN